jgi:hypothetical protein
MRYFRARSGNLYRINKQMVLAESWYNDIWDESYITEYDLMTQGNFSELTKITNGFINFMRYFYDESTNTYYKTNKGECS